MPFNKRRGTNANKGRISNIGSIKNFKIVAIGNQQVLYGVKSNVPVACKDDLYNKIYECHQRIGHGEEIKPGQKFRKTTAIYGEKPSPYSFAFVRNARQDCQLNREALLKQ